MDKKSTLIIGVGAAGAKLTDAILSRDSRYEGFYINSSVKDVKPRKFATIGRNVYIIPNADGTGKDRNKGKSYIVEQQSALADKLSEYELFDDIVITFSMGGGTGSSFSPLITMIIARILPKTRIHLVAIKPKMKSSKKILQNAIDTWNDITKVKDLCASITILDNDKREKEEIINEDWAKDFDDMINLTVGDPSQVLDESDLNNLLDNRSKDKDIVRNKGLNILRLKSELNDSVELAMEMAMRESVYVETSVDEVVNLGISLKGNDFNKDEIEEFFFIENDVFEGRNDIGNIVVTSGAELPKLAFELIEEEIKAREDDVRKRKQEKLEKKENLIIGSNKKEKVEEVIENIDISSAKSSKEIDDIFKDGFFDDIM